MVKIVNNIHDLNEQDRIAILELIIEKILATHPDLLLKSDIDEIQKEMVNFLTKDQINQILKEATED